VSFVTDLWFRLRNNQYLKARNAADNADVNVIKIDAASNIVLASTPYVGSASAPNALATTADLANVVNGLSPKTAAKLATTAPVTLAGAALPYPTIDGVLAISGDRIVVKNQAAAENNGIYVITDDTTNYIFTRATDFDSLSPLDEINGAYVAVQAGTQNKGKMFIVGTPKVVTLGTDPINFVLFNATDFITGSDGVAFSGNQISLTLDGTTLIKAPAGLKVSTAGVTTNELATATSGAGKINATSFQMSTAYAAADSVIASGSTIQAAIEALDARSGAIAQARQEEFTLTTASTTTVLALPAQNDKVTVSAVGGPIQEPGVDYTMGVDHKTITFAGNLLSVVQANNGIKLVISYQS
jgi:hypothetical protein